jgi:hypothetical protein
MVPTVAVYWPWIVVMVSMDSRNHHHRLYTLGSTSNSSNQKEGTTYHLDQATMTFTSHSYFDIIIAMIRVSFHNRVTKSSHTSSIPVSFFLSMHGNVVLPVAKMFVRLPTVHNSTFYFPWPSHDSLHFFVLCYLLPFLSLLHFVHSALLLVSATISCIDVI